MKFLHLVWAGIWRKKGRAILTLLSIVNAFLIFGLLQGLKTGIDNVAQGTEANVLMVFSRVSQIEGLPMGHGSQIRTVGGVEAVTPMLIFTSTYRTPTQFVPAIAVNVDEYVAVYPESKPTEAQLVAMRQTRNGAIVGANMARNYGWKVGDTVPLRSMFWMNLDTGSTWPVKIVGILPKGGPGMMVNYEYVDEGRTQQKGTTSFFLLKTKDAKQAGAIASRVDALFANSPYETRTITPRQMAQSQLKQIGDIGLVINAIVGAIFFALLFSVGAVMAQQMRERIPELAVLKTLGFTDGGVLALVVAETLIFCVFSAGIGLGIAELLFPLIREAIGFRAAAGPILFAGFGFAVALALIAGLPPAIRAMRLQIVDALAGR
ncbi:ABC transporter permease [Phenylobacterium sp.]|jgi:putative ABC transport system permease protein|uniref:ABC transporter permease n=1 Tax=Phenylobacterium sp. TaxID=1871053 RepID=UPI002F945B9B